MQRIATDALDRLLALLRAEGYRLVGPTVRDGAIVYDDIAGAHDLPAGWTDEQAPGRYRLVRRDDDARFGHVVGPDSWKKELFPPSERLLESRRDEDTLTFVPAMPAADPVAFIGVRACDLAAIAIQDRVFTGSGHGDPRYAMRRASAFVVAVNCLEPGGLCFCPSMETGPRAREGFDLCLTEFPDHFLAEAGSARGEALLARLEPAAASADERRALERGIAAAREAMGRAMDTRGLPAVLYANLDHPRWDDVAKRCLACGNCTQACPTCFCHTVEEVPSLDPATQARERRWDSCFTAAHGYLHGGGVRPRTRERYRQWLTHKLAGWHSQFGTSGCTGCGRCIAWCPVGIDLTEEVAAIRADGRRGAPLPAPRAVQPVAGDAMLPQAARVRRVRAETADVLTLEVEPAGPFHHRHGQFNMLSVPGVGESAISISGTDGTSILHTVRGVGATSRALAALVAGDSVGLRGPFGAPWPMDAAHGRTVTFIAGGIGLAPLRGAIRETLARPDLYPSVRLLLGARAPDEILYREEILAWNQGHEHFKASVTVDHAAPGWTGHVGVVTTLMRRKPRSPHGVYFMCGPEIMMRFAVDDLLEAGVPAEAIWVSMERNMKCAAGLCGRCQYGPYFVCRDGPVMRYDRVAPLFREAGF